jgi:hypothetical protein
MKYIPFLTCCVSTLSRRPLLCLLVPRSCVCVCVCVCVHVRVRVILRVRCVIVFIMMKLPLHGSIMWMGACVVAVSVTTVGEVREVLSVLHSQLANRNMGIDRFRAQMAQTEAFQSWIPWKHRVLGLFAQTLECEHVPCFAAPADGAQRLIPAPGIKPAYESHPSCAQHDARLGCGWPLQTFPVAWHDAAAAVLTQYDDLCASEKAREAQNRRQFGGPCSPLNYNHNKKGETLNTLVQCLKACVTSGVAQPCRCCAPGSDDVAACAHRRPHIPIAPRQVGLLRRFALRCLAFQTVFTRVMCRVRDRVSSL